MDAPGQGRSDAQGPGSSEAQGPGSSEARGPGSSETPGQRRSDGHGQEAFGAPPTNRMVVTLLSLVGLFVALYLFAHNAGWTGPIVCGVGDCATVQSSEYARIGAVPVSAVGLAGYAALLALALTGLQPAYRRSRVIGALLLAGSAFGVIFSAYLTYLEAFVIRAWCQYCVISAILITLVLLASLPEIGRLRGAGSAPRSPDGGAAAADGPGGEVRVQP